MSVSKATRKFLDRGKTAFKKTKAVVKFKGRNYSIRENLDKAYYGEGQKFKKPSNKLTPREKFLLKLKYGRVGRSRAIRPQTFIPSPLEAQQQRWNQFQQSQTQALQNRRVNMWAKDFNAPTPFESVMDTLFGVEGERILDNSVAIFPSLNSSDAGDLISSIQQEMNIFSDNPQPQRRFVRRRR